MKRTNVNSCGKCRYARKGVAIELALVLLVLIFALCSLLVSLAVIQSKTAEQNNNDLSERLILDNIAESFCGAVASGTIQKWTADSDDYASEVEQSGDGYTLKLYETNGEDNVLTVTLEKSEEHNGYRVTMWEYRD
ncbi:MAG: hypothetical protein IKL40_06290 [Clostridia bacterium]|nr:hypothetical protein [Clostridia bacterium]